jgi:hypothetical protein
MKGGSDTIPKLLWLNMYDPPCNAPQSHAIAGMILLGCVVVHRLNHFFTAKDNREEYPLLKHFCKVASERSTFHITLLQIVDSIKIKIHLFLPLYLLLLHQLLPELVLGSKTQGRWK